MTLGDGGSTGAADGSAPTFQLQALNDRGWMPPPRTSGTIQQLAAQADMAVFVVQDLTEVPGGLAAEVSAAVRDQGGLVAAVVVGSEHWDTPRGQAAMADLREAVDMLVAVRETQLAASFVDVLRGGTRESAP